MATQTTATHTDPVVECKSRPTAPQANQNTTAQCITSARRDAKRNSTRTRISSLLKTYRGALAAAAETERQFRPRRCHQIKAEPRLSFAFGESSVRLLVLNPPSSGLARLGGIGVSGRHVVQLGPCQIVRCPWEPLFQVQVIRFRIRRDPKSERPGSAYRLDIPI